MVVVGITVAALAAFVASSAYYTLLIPMEQRVLGGKAMDRGRPGPAQILTELLRTVLTAGVFAWIAGQADRLELPDAVVLAVVLWVGFPLVLLTGSVIWEKVPSITAAMHAGDWLLKLLLIAVIVGLLH